MLILSRYIGESTIVDNGKEKIIITILAATRGQVKLGIKASEAFSVHREEICTLIKKSKEQERR